MLIGQLSDTYELAYQYVKQLFQRSSERDSILLAGNAHPDFKCIMPESAQNDVIKIDQVRELIIWSVGRPQIASQKVAIIYPANAMNIQAANALLKTLEEPNDDLLIILVSDQPLLLPATIRSRCFSVRCPNQFTQTIPDEIQQDLQDMVHRKIDPCALAERWVKQAAAKTWVDYLMMILSTAVRTQAQRGIIIQKKKWWVLFDHLYEAKRQLEISPASNAQLLLETLLFEYIGTQNVY